MFGEVAHREFGVRMKLRPVQDVVDRDMIQHEPGDARGKVVQLVRHVDPVAGPLNRVTDQRRHEEDVTEHHQHQEGEHAFVDDARIPENEQQGDLRHAFPHQPGSDGVRDGEAGNVGADERAGEVSEQRDQRQPGHGPRRQGRERETETQSGRSEEEGHEQSVRDAAETGDDLTPHVKGQPRQRRAEQQCPQRTVQAHHFRAEDHQEQHPEQQAQRKLRYLDYPLQQRDRRRQSPGHQDPGHHRESGDFGQQNQDPGRGYLLVVFPYTEPDHQQHDQFGDDHHRENLQSDRFFQLTVVGEHFGHDAQAGHRQHAGQGQRLHETQSESEIENDFRGDQQGGSQRADHGKNGGDEVAAAEGGHEAGYVYLVDSDQEKEQENAQRQHQFEGQCGLDPPDAG